MCLFWGLVVIEQLFWWRIVIISQPRFIILPCNVVCLWNIARFWNVCRLWGVCRFWSVCCLLGVGRLWRICCCWSVACLRSVGHFSLAFLLRFFTLGGNIV